MAQTLTISRKDQITEVAQNLFRERGYAATSMRDLAAVIGIEPASLYSHIKSKEAILQQICFRIADEFFQAIAPLKQSTLSPDALLKAAIVAHVQVIADNVDASAVFLHDWRYLTEPHMSQFKEMRKEYEAFFRNILQDGIRQGAFQDDGITLMLLTLFSSVNWIYDWYSPEGSLEAKEIGEKLADIYIKGIHKK